MDECNMTAVMHTGSYCILTAHSMTRMTSLTGKLLVNFVTNLVSTFARNSNRKDDIRLIGRFVVRFRVEHVGMVCTTLAHPQMNYHVSQFGHWNQDKADTKQNRNPNCFSQLQIVKSFNLAICFSADAGSVTIPSSESDFYMVISSGGNMQW